MSSKKPTPFYYTKPGEQSLFKSATHLPIYCWKNTDDANCIQIVWNIVRDGPKIGKFSFYLYVHTYKKEDMCMTVIYQR